jgi:hypothetical protein
VRSERAVWQLLSSTSTLRSSEGPTDRLRLLLNSAQNGRVWDAWKAIEPACHPSHTLARSSALLLRWSTTTRSTTTLHPLLHALLHFLLVRFKLLFLVIVQNGFNLGLGIGANALHLCHTVFTR